MVCCHGCLDAQSVHLLSQLSCDQDRSNKGVPTSRCHLITGITSEGSTESGTYSPGYNKSRCTSCRTDGIFYILYELHSDDKRYSYFTDERFDSSGNYLKQMSWTNGVPGRHSRYGASLKAGWLGVQTRLGARDVFFSKTSPHWPWGHTASSNRYRVSSQS
jgi:hypothetical protein